MERTPSTTPSTLQQAAELLERSQQLLRSASLEEGTNTTTAARVRQMTTAQLQRDPVLWAAYTRGWVDRTAVFMKATSGEPTTMVRHNRSRSPRRATRPVATARPAATTRPAPPTSTTRAPVRLPPRPLMERPTPAPRTSTIPPPGTLVNPLPTPNTTTETTTPATLNARQRRNKQRMRDYKAKQTSQQHRLEKPGSTATPAPSQPEPATPDLTVATVPEVTNTSGTTGTAENLTAAHPQTADMEISPEEEADLLGETDAGTAGTEDMEVSLMYFSPPTSPQRA
ncbi:probable serine/threonine-protein kinase DDB_G0281745 [Metopolophium dirhodum]|uniref:probable serine/threonine-protein kinase DDB_G0281745 n=1 Tax=Metopolophium dirhodum TaxID=44670 RepID=UPI0029906847|nr:probable serine/threonine-protein kinase DDB_G0281745 [Metopolophium dirhodum]XP_060865171.1 probable serine/threonine-protein kinase DDB_G0281745 [Metopolophium dirhodum]